MDRLKIQPLSGFFICVYRRSSAVKNSYTERIGRLVGFVPCRKVSLMIPVNRRSPPTFSRFDRIAS